MKYIRACAVCQTYFPPTDWLCSFCWKVLEREYLHSRYIYRVEKKLSHFRLLDWHPDNYQTVKSFVYSLKQGGPDFLFKRLALEMFSRLVHFNLWNKQTIPIFVPAPFRKVNQKDHAGQLAHALSYYFGGNVCDLLKRSENYDSQKNKTRRQRVKIELQKILSIPSDRTIVFVDDVLTTGSTARAAFQTLNCPKKFFIFTLIWKRPPAKQEVEDVKKDMLFIKNQQKSLKTIH